MIYTYIKLKKRWQGRQPRQIVSMLSQSTIPGDEREKTAVFITKQKRFDVLIKTPKRFTSNVEAFLNGLFTALPNAGQWLPLPASDTNADADDNSATLILLPMTGNPLSNGKGSLSHCPVCSADCKARPVQPSSTDEIETSFLGFSVIYFL